MCGIFSWSGLKPGVFNRDKFDKLGILNETRGKHSCGISIDGEIYIGTGDSKVYRDFIVNNTDIEDPKRYPVVLGHTRHATVGAHTADNAHPFGFGSIPGEDGRSDFAFIGVHNGSLLNHKELAAKYDINPKAPTDNKWERDKIDSEILLEILYRTKNFKVLSDYNGAAALIWSFLEDPDTVYYYHGKSAKQEGDETKLEERPLWYYKQTKNSLYTSSQPEGLKTIGAVEELTLGEFEHNTVYKVVNGDLENAKKYRISRAGNYQKTGGTGKKKNGGTSGTANSNTGTNSTSPSKTSTQGCKVGTGNSKRFKANVNIYDETPVQDVNKYGGSVYMNKLRYWRNGHRIQGFWTYIEGYGFYELGQRIKDAEESFWNIVGKVFLRGEFKNIDQISEEDLNMGWIPFKNDAKNPITNPAIETFYDGIRIESPKDLQGCVGMESVGRAFDIPTLSIIAKHPIMDITYSSRSDKDQQIYIGGKLCTDKVCPMGSERVYDIQDGNLVAYTDIIEVKETENLIEEVENLPVSGTQLPLLPEADIEKSYVDDDFMENYLRKVFDGPVENLKNHKKQLNQYLPNMQAKRAIKVIEYLENCVRNLLEVEEKQ